MEPTISKLQFEARMSEKTIRKLSETPVPTPRVIDRDPVKPGHRRRTYTLQNPPPHLREIPERVLATAYAWAWGDWYLIDPIPNGARVHNNHAMANAFRKTRTN